MYPPGQFAAWNLGQDGPSAASQPGGDRDLTARARRDSGLPDQSSRPTAQAAEAGSRYYDGSGAEPGYSVLAVSDPAADVTSTQTWEAVGDGRSTGTWTAPARPGAGPDGPEATRRARSSGPRQTSGRHSAPPDAARPDVAPQDFARSDTALPDPAWPVAADPGTGWPGVTQPGTAGRDDIWPGSSAVDSAWPATRRPESGRRAGPDSGGFDQVATDRDRPGRSGSDANGPGDVGSTDSSQRRSGGHSRPQATVRSQSLPGAVRAAEPEPGPAPGKRSSTRKRSAGSNRPGGGKRSAGPGRPASVKLAMTVALLLVLTAAGTLAYTVLHNGDKPKPVSTANTNQPKITPSASPSPSLGPYGHIASRQSDPQALTVAQLFPASFTVSGKPVTLTASAISRRCGGALTGSNIQSAVSSAHCDQAVRATYLSSSQGLMGTVGVLNLSSAARAAKAAKAADADDFISQLKGKRGPTRKIGNGTGIEEALAKGHYLILIWAEFTSLRKPRTAAQRTKVEDFMTELLDNTANVSLTTRMLTGTA